MINKLLAFSVRAHWSIVFLTVMVAAYGVYELSRLPLDAGALDQEQIARGVGADGARARQEILRHAGDRCRRGVAQRHHRYPEAGLSRA